MALAILVLVSTYFVDCWLHCKARFTRVPTNFCADKNLHGPILRLHGNGGTGRIFEWPRVPVWELLSFRSQTCTPAPAVSCKRKLEPCKFLSVQKLVGIRANGV